MEFPSDKEALLHLVERMLRYGDVGFADVFALLHEIEAQNNPVARDSEVWKFLLKRALQATEGRLDFTTSRHKDRRKLSHENKTDCFKFREAVYAPRKKVSHLCIMCLRMTTTLYPIEWARFESRLREPWMIYCTDCWKPAMWPRSMAMLKCPKMLTDYPHLLHTKRGEGGILLYSVEELRFWATMPKEMFEMYQSEAPSPAAPPVMGMLARNNYRKRKSPSS